MPYVLLITINGPMVSRCLPCHIRSSQSEVLEEKGPAKEVPIVEYDFTTA